MNYIPLHIKTHYELLSSLIKIEDLINFAQKNKVTALGITDSNMFGCMEFINSCKRNNIKPIVGITIEIENLKMILYAMNYDGYINLLNIVSIKNTETLTKEELKKHKENIICVTNDYDNYLEYKEIYEVIYLSYKTQEEKKSALLTSDKVVYMKESLYIDSLDKEYLIYLKMIKDGKTIDSFKEYNFDNHLNKDIEEIDALKTYEFANLINIELPIFHFKLPEYCENKVEHLTYLCNKGLNKRLNGLVTQEYN